jgi:predicted alpha/beta superfamily hydrolase
MNWRVFFAAVGLVLICATHGMADPITCGERVTLHSKILGEERTVFISVPVSYTRGAQRYPVLYLTDAQGQFDQSRSSAAFLARNGLVPEIIVVGVANNDRTRDLYATKADFKANGRTIPFPNSGHSDQFLEFLEKELIPWIDSTYRTTPLRILAGVSAGGNFALHAMRMRPGLFQAIIAASPWLAWDDARELKQLVPFLESAELKTRALFVSYANEEHQAGPEMKGNVETVIRVLRARKDASVRWASATYPDEDHETTVLKSYFDAIRMVFADWRFPRDTQNKLMGSLDDVKAHYARFGEGLGYTQLPPENVVNELGYQLLGMKALDQSLAAFRYNIEIYPQSANVWDSLADALEQAGKTDDALASCHKAVSLAEANGDPSLESFRKHAVRLANSKKPDEK